MLFESSFLFIAGFLGGILNSIAGGGTFITFPALLFVGVPPVSANATNTFASCSGYVSGTYAFRKDLQRHRKELPKIFLISIVGGITADVENGDIDVTVILPADETIDLTANNGSLELNIPVSTSAEFYANVDKTGKIVVSDLDFTESWSADKSVIGTLGNGEGSISLNTVNGNIEVWDFD